MNKDSLNSFYRNRGLTEKVIYPRKPWIKKTGYERSVNEEYGGTGHLSNSISPPVYASVPPSLYSSHTSYLVPYLILLPF